MWILTLDSQLKRSCKTTGSRRIRGRNAHTTRFYSSLRPVCYNRCPQGPRSRRLFAFLGTLPAQMEEILRLALLIQVQIRRVIALIGNWLKLQALRAISLTFLRFRMWTTRRCLRTTTRRLWTVWLGTRRRSRRTLSSGSTQACSCPNTSNGLISWIHNRWVWRPLPAEEGPRSTAGA